MSTQTTQSEIKFNVHLDASRLPVKIDWTATESGFADNKGCKAMLVSIFDEKEKNTLKIDLWTNEMLIEEMKQFFAETLSALGDTYQNATGETEAAESIRQFARDFAKKAGILEK